MGLNREEWLEKAAARLLDEFDLPDTDYSIHWGWPSKGGLSTKRRTVGECWKPEAASDGVPPIFISPILHDTVDILGTVLHELIHAWDKGESGHKGAFASTAKGFGFEAPLTVVSLGPDLEDKLRTISGELGEFPFPHITPIMVNKKPQKTYMVKMEADGCGCIARATSKYIIDGQPFLCPHGAELVPDKPTQP